MVNFVLYTIQLTSINANFVISISLLNIPQTVQSLWKLYKMPNQ